jgi:hypothetical protein
MATIKKAQGGGLLRKGVKAVTEKAIPKLEKSTVQNVVKKVGRDDLKAKMKNWDAELLKGKKKMQNGGSLSGLKGSTKRDKGIDPKGAFTQVQQKAISGAKGNAPLTRDKKLGATKMKSGGKMSKKK